MDQKGIDRINELARKAKTQELTPEEKKEQHKLRKEFIASVRMNLRSQLDNINIQEKDGSITNLRRKIWKQRKPLEKKFSDAEKKRIRHLSVKTVQRSGRNFSHFLLFRKATGSICT